MSENSNEKVSDPTLETGVPTPSFSNEGDSPTSDLSPSQIATLKAALLPDIEDAIGRSLQSTKDKRFGKLEEGTNAVRDAIARIEAAGGTIPAEVKRDFETQDFVKQSIAAAMSNNKGPEAPVTGMTRDMAMEKANKTLEKFGIPSNDPALMALWLSKKYSDNPTGYLEMIDDVTTLAAKRISQPNPEPGQEAAATGRRVVTATGLEALKEQYEADMKKLRGDPDVVAKVRAEYRAKGLNI